MTVQEIRTSTLLANDDLLEDNDGGEAADLPSEGTEETEGTGADYPEYPPEEETQ